jgi:hypothetical protein
VKKRLLPVPSPVVGENERGGKEAWGLGFPNLPTPSANVQKTNPKRLFVKKSKEASE